MIEYRSLGGGGVGGISEKGREGAGEVRCRAAGSRWGFPHSGAAWVGLGRFRGAGGTRTTEEMLPLLKTPGSRQEGPWTLPSSHSPQCLTDGSPLGAAAQGAPCSTGVCRVGKENGVDLSCNRQSPPLKSRLGPRRCLLGGQCPSLTFLMSSERKLRTYFTDGGCFTHRGCFTVCEKEHSVGCR